MTKRPRHSYEAHAEEKGFLKVPALAVVREAMAAVAARGEEASAKAIASHLRAEGFDIDRRWCAQVIATHKLERQTAIGAIRTIQAERAVRLADVIDLAPAFQSNAAVKAAIVALATKLAKGIEDGSIPVPTEPGDIKALIQVIALADQASSAAFQQNLEAALLVPGGLANGARDVTPTRGKFAHLIDGTGDDAPVGRFASLK